MTKICPNCGGGLANCPICNAPPKRVLPKSSPLFNKIYSSLFGATYWEVQGIDVSKWNGIMDFKISKSKCQYVIMRAGYGTQWKDAAIDTYYRDARAQDMPVGLYWYLNIGQDANLTAESFAGEITTHPYQTEIVLDAESTTLNPTDTLNWLKTCDTKLTALTGKKAMLYTSAGFWERVAPSNYWTGRTLWVANWTTRDTPYLPQGWYQWLHWQWSADGNLKASEYGMVSGGDPDMDLDRFNGTCAQFNAKYGTHIVPIGANPQPPQPPVPPVPPVVPEYVIITTSELAIHSTPQAIQTNIIGHALLNTKWYPYELVVANGISWYRVGKNAYISKNYTRLP